MTKRRRFLPLLSIPILALLLTGFAGTESSQETYRFQPMQETDSGPVVQATPDVPVTDAGAAAQPAAFGSVVVSELPTSAWPEESGLRAHIQGEFHQDQIVEEGDVRNLLPAPDEEYFEPQFPTVAGEAAPEDVGGPLVPGGGVRQWDALSNTGWIPPDTIHAVGPNHVVEAVNSGFAIYTKFGTQVQGYTTFQNFLNKPAGWAGFMFDPRVVYDAFHGKFIMLVLGRDDTPRQSYFWVAISQTNNPTGAWWLYRYNSTDTTGASAAWLDYAGVSADNWGIYITGNFFYFTGGFRGSNVWTIGPAAFTGGSGNGWRFWDLRWPSNSQAFALQPAHPHSANANQQTFFVNTFSGSGSQVCLWRMSGDRTNAPSLTRVAIGTAGYEAIGNNVDQPGSATDIDGGDARVMNAVYSQGRVFFTLTDDVNNNGDAAGWLTVKINVNNNTNEFQHLLWSGAGIYYFYPAVTILGGSTANANLAVFGSWTRTSGGSNFASGLFKIYDNQPAGSTGPFITHRAGSAAYVALDSSGRNRWGDYSGAGYDWSCGHAWGSVESADTGNRWRTTINAVQFGNEPVCPQVEVTVPNTALTWNAGTTQTIRWLSQGLVSANQIRVFVQRGGTSTQVGTLAGTSTLLNWPVVSPTSTAARVRVEAWSGASLLASDVSDVNFIITAPDLRVVSPSVSKSLLLPGEAFTANATANNQGNGSSNVGTTLRYYRSTDATITTGDTQIATDAIPVLGAGGNSAQNAGVTAPTALGNYWIGACVDAVAGESSTANQCSTGVPITVAQPDLTMLTMDAPASANPGSMINVSNTVRNQGGITTVGNFSVGIYYSADNVCTTGDTLIGSRVVGPLAAGGQSAANNMVTIPGNAAPGTRYICGFADYLSQVAESSETNNTRFDPIDIQALVPTVNLKVNGVDAVFPTPVVSAGPVRLTLDMTPGSKPLDHYFAIILSGTVLWVTPGGLSTTAAPLATFTPSSITNAVLLNSASWPAGSTIFAWLMLDGGTVVGSDLILVNVTSSPSPTE